MRRIWQQAGYNILLEGAAWGKLQKSAPISRLKCVLSPILLMRARFIFFEASMRILDELDKAIEAHLNWKQKLQVAIQSGHSALVPESIWSETNCAFGRWLCFELPEQDRNNPYYNNVRNIHSDFHKSASKVLSLALSGHAEDALSAISEGGEYSEVSEALIAEVKLWKEFEEANLGR